MNLTGQKPYQKGEKRKRSNIPTKAQRERWEIIRALGCISLDEHCGGRIEIHHIETKSGCKKNHDRVIPLCFAHHRGSKFGFHEIGSKVWQYLFGSEQFFLDKTEALIK